MRFPLHATAGVVAFTAAMAITGSVAEAPLTSFGVAALAGLIPDLDNPNGSVLKSRRRFMVVEALFSPTALMTGHRQRSHSLLGIGLFALLCLFYALLASWLFGASFPLVYLIAAVAGYASHLVMDMFNKPGVPLLWPIGLAFYFPPMRRLRMAADNPFQDFITVAFLMLLGYLILPHSGAIVETTAADRLPGDVISGVFRLVSETLAMIGSLVR